MNHPIYKDTVYAKAYEAYKRDKVAFMKISKSMGDVTTGMVMHMATMQAIVDSGHVLIDMQSEDWESDISKKTIQKMRPSDINFPFKAGAAIDTKSSGGVIFFNITKDHMDLSFEVNDMGDGERGIMSQRIGMDMFFGELPDIGITHEDEVYRLVAVLIYISMFKREKSRIIENTTNKLKASKKRSIPSHRIHTILVRQPKSSRPGNDGDRGRSNKSWIVKGHLRNQWYAKGECHKPKWIDMYWKGDGKEKIEKIYKV